MAQRPIPSGYYAMTIKDLRGFITGGLHPGREDAPIQVEIDGQRFPVIKIVRGLGDAIVLRVPSEPT